MALPETALGYWKSDLLTPRLSVKISRTKMGQCVLAVCSMAGDNQAI